MPPTLTSSPTQERKATTLSGWPMIAVVIALFAASIFFFLRSLPPGNNGVILVTPFVLALALCALACLLCPGFFTLQPNEARVLVLFGSYRGTAREGGFRWANPFYSNGPDAKQPLSLTTTRHHKEDQQEQSAKSSTLKRYKISLRVRTLNSERLKVNDQRGNPVDIAAVVVWRVDDTARAVFDVDDYESYVATQSETALRHLASCYPYDRDEEESAGESDGISLRGNVDAVSEALREELGIRLAQAGVTVEQARLSHLAYSPEIAQAMLRRQQAEAVIAARRKIVTGAVGMVELALKELSEGEIVTLDEERKATMVSNLMVVLCSENQATPVINTGTLYQ